VLRLVSCACMPSPLPRQVRGNPFARTLPSLSAFPVRQVGRLLHQPFRGLLSVYSRYGLHARRVAYATLYTEGFSSFVASPAASVATGWNEPVPGRDIPPLKTHVFSRRTDATGFFCSALPAHMPRPIPHRSSQFSRPPFSASHFLGHCFGLIRPAASRLLLSRFRPYPIGFPPIKQPLALEAEALAFGCPKKMGQEKGENSPMSYLNS